MLSIEAELNLIIGRFMEAHRNIKSLTVATTDGFPISHTGKGDPDVIAAVVSQIIDNLKKLEKYNIFPHAKYLSISDEDGNWIYGKVSGFEELDFCVIMISRNIHGCQGLLEEITIEIIRIYLRHRQFLKYENNKRRAL